MIENLRLTTSFFPHRPHELYQPPLHKSDAVDLSVFPTWRMSEVYTQYGATSAPFSVE